MEIWTIGHSTRPIDTFLELLRRAGIESVADVRRYPGSRRQPQFRSDALRMSLATASIEYDWMPALGGRRKAGPIGKATAWKNASFQGYAEYMQTPEFEDALGVLRRLAEGRRTAIMCAEALWWQCHRRLIADTLLASGDLVSHIVDRGIEAHKLLPPARVEDGRLTYLPDQLTF